MRAVPVFACHCVCASPYALLCVVHTNSVSLYASMMSVCVRVCVALTRHAFLSSVFFSA